MDFNFHMPVHVVSGEGAVARNSTLLRTLGSECVAQYSDASALRMRWISVTSVQLIRFEKRNSLRASNPASSTIRSTGWLKLRVFDISHSP